MRILVKTQICVLCNGKFAMMHRKGSCCKLVHRRVGLPKGIKCSGSVITTNEKIKANSLKWLILFLQHLLPHTELFVQIKAIPICTGWENPYIAFIS